MTVFRMSCLEIPHRNTLPHSTLRQSANPPVISKAGGYAFSTVVVSPKLLKSPPLPRPPANRQFSSLFMEAERTADFIDAEKLHGLF
ncbi:hypothetical protein [Pseudomonas helmanticensis]|uniref:hypothetical protein n=1 Tax=Pseudomonas helmanticensis TaxID=1471381 RepID=UPI0037FF79A0